MSKVVIHQGYFLPYWGYFCLINAADEFVIGDNYQYTKKGWISRNRICDNSFITLPLKKDSDYLNINQRVLGTNWNIEAVKIINRIKEYYRKAPEFETVFPIFQEMLLHADHNLFNLIYKSVLTITEYLEIKTPIIVSSELECDHTKKHKERVFEICKYLKADKYLNAIGGMVLYNKEEFKQQGIQLSFLKVHLFEYKRFNSFIPGLSILDLMFFVPRQELIQHLNDCEEI